MRRIYAGPALDNAVQRSTNRHMNFATPEYAVLLSVTFVAYYLFCNLQIPILIVASLIFYGWQQPDLLTLLLAVSVFASALTYAILRGRVAAGRAMAAGVAVNLAVLAFFKYKFLVVDPTATVGHTIADFLISIPLPIGISFFTFQAISIIVDTYKGALSEKGRHLNLRQFMSAGFFYVVFFPQLVAGPIVKAHQFFPQIAQKNLSDVAFFQTAQWIIWGLFFKRFVADNINQFTVWMNSDNFVQLGSGDLILLLICYSAQIFADFAGYSAIAIGSAGLFGYRLPLNFNRPYIAASFADFWTRWHISLSSFLKEYLYIPLGGNRKGAVRTYINLIVVMALGGLWHGAALSFMVWGLAHGAFLALERRTVRHFPDGDWFRLLYSAFVFFCVSLLWLFFKLTDFSSAQSYIAHIFSADTWWHFDKYTYVLVACYSAPVLIHHLLKENHTERSLVPLYAGMAFLAFFDAGATDAFIYFRF